MDQSNCSIDSATLDTSQSDLIRGVAPFQWWGMYCKGGIYLRDAYICVCSTGRKLLEHVMKCANEDGHIDNVYL